MRISDWSSDVCSSDLLRRPGTGFQHDMARGEIGQPGGRREAAIPAPLHRLVEGRGIAGGVGLFDRVEVEFGHGAVLLRWLLFCFAQRHEDTKRLYAGDRKSTRLNSSH